MRKTKREKREKRERRANSDEQQEGDVCTN